MKKLLILFVSLSLLLALASCGKGDDNTPPPPQQDGESVQPENPGEADVSADPADPGLVPKDDEPLLPDPESTGDDLADLGEDADAPRPLAASHSDVTLQYVGETFQMSVLGVEGYYASTFASDAPEVASVDKLTGEVTAVSPGAAVVSMHVECESGQYDFECLVRCVWTEEPVLSGDLSGEEVLASLPERFDFASGVGAWSTELNIAADGTFTGFYHDSNAGESGEGYSSSYYYCKFSGKFSTPVKVNDYTYSMNLESMELEEEPGQETIDADGTRWVTSTPYGLEEAKEVLIFLPGAPTEELPEYFLSWVRNFFWDWNDEKGDTLPRYGLYNVKEGLGFAGIG